MTENRRYRIGHGVDVHAFADGRDFVLGGVKVPAARGLKGHSDADALIHAIVDALLGATGRGDIGTLFPDTDPAWKNAESTVFLKKVWAELATEGWRIENVDCAILAQVPKLSPHVPSMKKVLGEILSLPMDAIGIKATTAESLGFVGREEGILASASVLLSRDTA